MPSGFLMYFNYHIIELSHYLIALRNFSYVYQSDN